MRPAQSSTTSAKASLPAARSSTGRRRQTGSTLWNVYATYCPAIAEIVAAVRPRATPCERLQRIGCDVGPEAPEARLRRVVRVEEPRLPAPEVALVDDVEDQKALHRGLAVGEVERLRVRGCLAALA